MTSKHYRWQTRWAVDKAAGTARHECGLVVRVSGPGVPAAADNAPKILAALAVKHGGHNAPRMLERMLREAAELIASDRPRDARMPPPAR